MPPTDDEFRAGLDELREAYTRAMRELIAFHDLDPEVAFRLANEFQMALAAMVTEVAEQRARSAQGIRDKHVLSLAGLARKLGVSKGRAQQLIDAARKGNGS